jgi:predicted house-cleaning noncanonical NTP pyrophosphatase (MazG superfamily)
LLQARQAWDSTTSLVSDDDFELKAEPDLDLDQDHLLTSSDSEEHLAIKLEVVQEDIKNKNSSEPRKLRKRTLKTNKKKSGTTKKFDPAANKDPNRYIEPYRFKFVVIQLILGGAKVAAAPYS